MGQNGAGKFEFWQQRSILSGRGGGFAAILCHEHQGVTCRRMLKWYLIETIFSSVRDIHQFDDLGLKTWIEHVGLRQLGLEIGTSRQNQACKVNIEIKNVRTQKKSPRTDTYAHQMRESADKIFCGLSHVTCGADLCGLSQARRTWDFLSPRTLVSANS